MGEGNLTSYHSHLYLHVVSKGSGGCHVHITAVKGRETTVILHCGTALPRSRSHPSAKLDTDRRDELFGVEIHFISDRMHD